MKPDVKKRSITVFRFLLLIGWMGLIFYFSAQNSEISSGQSMPIADLLGNLIKIPAETLEAVIRKLAHFSIYLVLGALAANSVGRLQGAKWYIVLAVCVLYSLSDEFHQTFVSGRSGEFRDVFIDSCGSGLGIYAFWLLSREKIIVSACLLGRKCRYDGKAKKFGNVAALKKRYKLIAVCPELLGGLETPRLESEIRNGRVYSKDLRDLTEYFEKGAQEVLIIAKKNKCRKAVLKERSPSCGSHKIYDGTFSGKTVSGKGITAALLEENGITVVSEEETEKFTNS